MTRNNPLLGETAPFTQSMALWPYTSHITPGALLCTSLLKQSLLSLFPTITHTLSAHRPLVAKSTNRHL